MDFGLALSAVLWILGVCFVGPVVWMDPEPPVGWKDRLGCVGMTILWPLLVVISMARSPFLRR